MNLYIDTTDFNKIIFGLSSLPLGKIRKQVFKLKPNESFKTIAKLEAFLKSAGVVTTSLRLSPNLGRETIEKIYVNKGPGSFVGTRTGVTIAKALGFAWNIPVKFLPKDKFKIG